MFNLICVFFFILLGIIGIFFPENEAIYVVGIAFLCFSGLWFIVSSINNFYCYAEQQKKFEELRASLKKISILKEKSEKILAEFKLYLGEKYPELEKQIFSDISNSAKDSDKWGMFVTKYPKIQSSKTFNYLVSEMDSLISEIYKLKMEIENDCSSIRFFIKNKWFIIKPKIPTDLEDTVNNPLPKKEE
jgi:hypothetical protein